jgi:hypothetical protein
MEATEKFETKVLKLKKIVLGDFLEEERVPETGQGTALIKDHAAPWPREGV